jgi:hypothetical protein
MAAEFSRELGEKVFRGKIQLAQLGFWMGGPPGYGGWPILFAFSKGWGAMLSRLSSLVSVPGIGLR